MQLITQGLIIDEPWISKILAGEKVWEMRSRRTSKTGPIALIKKGSGTIVGTAILSGSRPPLNQTNWMQHFGEHCVPESLMRQDGFNWFTPWVLEDVRRLSRPIPYDHPNGAVQFVNLSRDVSTKLDTSVFDAPAVQLNETDRFSKELDALDREIAALKAQGVPGGPRLFVSGIAALILCVSMLAWIGYILYAVTTWTGSFAIFAFLGVTIAVSSFVMHLTADEKKAV